MSTSSGSAGPVPAATAEWPVSYGHTRHRDSASKLGRAYELGRGRDLRSVPRPNSGLPPRAGGRPDGLQRPVKIPMLEHGTRYSGFDWPAGIPHRLSCHPTAVRPGTGLQERPDSNHFTREELHIGGGAQRSSDASRLLLECRRVAPSLQTSSKWRWRRVMILKSSHLKVCLPCPTAGIRRAAPRPLNSRARGGQAS